MTKGTLWKASQGAIEKDITPRGRGRKMSYMLSGRIAWMLRGNVASHRGVILDGNIVRAQNDTTA